MNLCVFVKMCADEYVCACLLVCVVYRVFMMMYLGRYVAYVCVYVFCLFMFVCACLGFVYAMCIVAYVLLHIMNVSIILVSSSHIFRLFCV